jgi:hypothetical protein
MNALSGIQIHDPSVQTKIVHAIDRSATVIGDLENTAS